MNLGPHLLSKVHIHEVKEQNLKKFQSLKEKEKITSLPVFNVGKNDMFDMCLGCKRCYTHGSVRNESVTHFNDHPECQSAFKTVITTLFEEKGVGMTDEEKLKKENDALKAEIQKLRQAPVIPTPDTIGMTSDSELKKKYDELMTEKEELEASNEELSSETSQYRSLFRTLLGDRYPKGIYGQEYFEELKKLITPPAPVAAPIPVLAPKLNEERVHAYVEASKAGDLEAQGKIRLTDAEMGMALKQIEEHFEKPKQFSLAPMPVPQPSAPKILTTTKKMMGKMTEREKREKGLL